MRSHNLLCWKGMPESTLGHFTGFAKPEANFFRLPNDWTDIAAAISSLAELKLVLYVLKHTWGYSEFDMVKKITTDEFMHGRKTRTGQRVDQGTGLAKQSVLTGLALAVAHGLLEVEVDDSDRARIKKSYKLRMQADETSGEQEREGQPEGKDLDVKEVDADVQKVDTGVQQLDSWGQNVGPRSEEERKREREKNVLNVIEPIRPGQTYGEARPGRSREEVGYYARALADKLGDQKSLTYYTLLCARFDPHQLLQKAAQIVGDGGARKPGAVFAAWAKTLRMPSTLAHPSHGATPDTGFVVRPTAAGG
jgi:DNA-binding PadR family transcriptional regulator